jgi:rhodanese-related sulfurtransferase
MSQIITVSELQAAIETPRQLILVDTLLDTAFAKGHLPGAINIRSNDISNAAPARLPDKVAAIVVYCASPRCQRAGKAAARLERSVLHPRAPFQGRQGRLARGGLAAGDRLSVPLGRSICAANCHIAPRGLAAGRDRRDKRSHE